MNLNVAATGWTLGAEALLREIWAQGALGAELERRLGCPAVRAYNKAYRMGLPPRAKQNIGARRNRQSKTRTPEREVVLRRMMAQGRPWVEIAAAINAQAGAPFLMAGIKSWARAIGAKKAYRARAGFVAYRAPPKPPPAPAEVCEAPIPRAAPGVALPPVPRTWEQIVDLAYREGREIKSRDDIVPWNRSRIARGIAPLCIRRPAPHEVAA
jgi:hypothetical protein